MNSKDILAKLLAHENLNIVRAPVSTASMDIKSRTLTLPQWKDMSDAVEEMLIGHEVGHALFTNEDYLKREDDDPSILHGYMNVIEDVRIEKKIKNKYPGLRTTFIQAYKELAERDFFELSGRNLSNINLIDRINLYYKIGINCGVKFTAAEMEFVRAADRCDTIQDVYKLAKEILGYSRNVLKEKKQSMPNDITLSPEDLEDMEEVPEDFEIDNQSIFDDEDPDAIDKEDEEDEESELRGRGSKEQLENPTGEIDERELEASTETALRTRLSDLADTNTVVQIYEPTLKTLYDPVISYKKILGELRPELNGYFNQFLANRYTEEWAANHKQQKYAELEKFKAESARVVSYLVKEFEMKKSATSYKRATIAKTGELNVRKLHSYKLTQDLFKRVTVLPDSKNHGMVFLLDWSGSMQNVMHDTIKQVINLAMFCQRAQIPYQVFAFTNGYPMDSSIDRYAHMHNTDPNFKGFYSHYFNLFEFFSSKMTNSEFNSMVELMFMEPYRYTRGYGLNSTPLNESLLYMVEYLGKFKRAHNVEKMSFITLTDGEGHGLYGASNKPAYGVRVVKYLRDPVTRREYPISDDGTSQTHTFLKVIKHRYDATVIGFHVIRNSRRDMDSFVKYNLNVSSGAEAFSLVENFKKQFREKDFAVVPNAAHDDLYLLPASKTAISEGELKVDENMNSKQIAKQFEKFLDVKKTSRVLLNRFVAQIA